MSSSYAKWHTDPEKEYIKVKNISAIQLKKTTSNKKVSLKRLFLKLIFTVEMNIAVNIGSIFLVYCNITDLRKRHRGQS